jgi:surface protein
MGDHTVMRLPAFNLLAPTQVAIASIIASNVQIVLDEKKRLTITPGGVYTMSEWSSTFSLDAPSMNRGLEPVYRVQDGNIGTVRPPAGPIVTTTEALNDVSSGSSSVAQAASASAELNAMLANWTHPSDDTRVTLGKLAPTCNHLATSESPESTLPADAYMGECTWANCLGESTEVAKAFALSPITSGWGVTNIATNNVAIPSASVGPTMAGTLAIPYYSLLTGSGDTTICPADCITRIVSVSINGSLSADVGPSVHSPAAVEAFVPTIRLPGNSIDGRDMRDLQGGPQLPSLCKVQSKNRAFPCISVEQTDSMGGSMGRAEAASQSVAPTDNALLATAVLLLLGATRLAWRPQRCEAASHSQRSGELWGIGSLWLIAVATVLLAAPGTHAVTAILNANIGRAMTAWATRPTTAKTTYGDIVGWNTATVTSMANPTATERPTFNADISKWNTASVSNMGAMFYGASAFNQNIAKWNVGRVANMRAVFQQASAFNQPIGSWNTATATEMVSMFSTAIAFNQPLTWNVASVSQMMDLFEYASAFNQNLAGWNTASVSSMNSVRSLPIAQTRADYPRAAARALEQLAVCLTACARSAAA